jgi:hypothetical protein
MGSYRCYQVSAQNKIQQAAHVIEAECDADAVLQAGRDIQTTADLPGIEIWQEARLVGRIARPVDLSSSPPTAA